MPVPIRTAGPPADHALHGLVSMSYGEIGNKEYGKMTFSKNRAWGLGGMMASDAAAVLRLGAEGDISGYFINDAYVAPGSYSVFATYVSVGDAELVLDSRTGLMSRDYVVNNNIQNQVLRTSMLQKGNLPYIDRSLVNMGRYKGGDDDAVAVEYRWDEMSYVFTVVPVRSILNPDTADS